MEERKALTVMFCDLTGPAALGRAAHSGGCLPPRGGWCTSPFSVVVPISWANVASSRATTRGGYAGSPSARLSRSTGKIPASLTGSCVSPRTLWGEPSPGGKLGSMGARDGSRRQRARVPRASPARAGASSTSRDRHGVARGSGPRHNSLPPIRRVTECAERQRGSGRRWLALLPSKRRHSGTGRPRLCNAAWS